MESEITDATQRNCVSYGYISEIGEKNSIHFILEL